MSQPRWVILIAVLMLSVVLPAGLCFALAVAPAHSLTDVVALIIVTGLWMMLVVLVNWWEFTSLLLRWLWLVALGGIAAAWLLIHAIAARRPHSETIDLRFPST